MDIVQIVAGGVFFGRIPTCTSFGGVGVFQAR
jgi:hypothetical protein